MQITSKGQVTIPQRIRERFGFLPNTEVEFVVEGDQVRLIKKTPSTGEGRGRRAVQLLRASGKVRMSTDEILALTRGE